jgi:beta-1,4-mannosyltransferase
LVSIIKKILVLPDAGPDNPFQYMMIDLLRNHGFSVTTAPKKRFYATTLAIFKHKPNIIYFDWIQSFILGKTLLVTLLKCVSFFLELQFVVRIKRIPVIHTLHNLSNHAGRWVWIERIIYTYFLKQCSKIRVYSPATREKAVKKFNLNPDRIFVVQDVPYHYTYPNTATPDESRRLFNLPSNAFVYLFLGTIKPYKGVERLINAFLQTATTNDYLLIAGVSDNPTYAEEVKSRASQDQRILLHNYFIKKEEVQYYYNAANVVVLPFKNIEHSGSVDLAMSFRRPVITLRTKFLQTLLKHQDFLLFDEIAELPNKLIFVKNMPRTDIDTTGETNFQIADTTNFNDLIQLFD